MEERSIYISSVDRERVGESVTHDFKIKLEITLKLDHNMKHEIAVDTIMMTYSWLNISGSYNNNKIKYSHDGGTSWQEITFIDGMYSYEDLNLYVHQHMLRQSHTTEGEYPINIQFILSSYRVVIELDNNYQVDLRATNFGDLIGFDKKNININRIQ